MGGLSSVSGFAWWRAELGIGAESQHGLSCPAVTVSTRVTGARKGQVFFLTFLVPIRVRLELCFMSSHSHVASGHHLEYLFDHSRERVVNCTLAVQALPMVIFFPLLKL